MHRTLWTAAIAVTLLAAVIAGAGVAGYVICVAHEPSTHTWRDRATWCVVWSTCAGSIMLAAYAVSLAALFL